MFSRWHEGENKDEAEVDIKGEAINGCNRVDVKTVNEIIDTLVAQKRCQAEEMMNISIARTIERTGRLALSKRSDARCLEVRHTCTRNTRPHRASSHLRLHHVYQQALQPKRKHCTGLALCHSDTLVTMGHPWVLAGQPQYTGAQVTAKVVTQKVSGFRKNWKLLKFYFLDGAFLGPTPIFPQTISQKGSSQIKTFNSKE